MHLLEVMLPPYPLPRRTQVTADSLSLFKPASERIDFPQIAATVIAAILSLLRATPGD